MPDPLAIQGPLAVIAWFQQGMKLAMVSQS